MYWIVVADGVSARIFGWDESPSPLEEIDTLRNEDGRVRNQDLEDDQAGRFVKGGERRGAYEKKSARDVSEERFAAHVADQIDANQGAFDALILLAAPRFLGQLRKELSKSTKQRLVGERAVNATKESAENIRKRAQKILEA